MSLSDWFGLFNRTFGLTLSSYLWCRSLLSSRNKKSKAKPVARSIQQSTCNWPWLTQQGATKVEGLEGSQTCPCPSTLSLLIDASSSLRQSDSRVLNAFYSCCPLPSICKDIECGGGGTRLAKRTYACSRSSWLIREPGFFSNVKRVTWKTK